MKPLAILLGIALCSAAVGRASAQTPTPQVAFSPASSSAAIGASVAVDITVANVASPPGLGGYSMKLSFDPAVVRLDSLADSGFISSGQLVVACYLMQINNAAGTAEYDCNPIQIFGAQGVGASSPVALLHASFTALSPGTSPLGLASSELNDPTGAVIAATFSSGSITVASPTPAPAVASPESSPTPNLPPPSSSPTPESVVAQPSATVAPVSTGTNATPASIVPTPSGAPLNIPSTGTGPQARGQVAWLKLAGVAAVLLGLALGLCGAAFLTRRPMRR